MSISKLLSYIVKYKKEIGISFNLSVLITLISIFMPIISQRLVDNGLVLLNFRNSLKYISIILFFSLVQELLSDLQSVIHIKIENNMYKDLSLLSFKHMLRIKYNHFEDVNFFENICSVENDVDNIVQMLSKDYLNVLTNILKIFGGIIGLLFIEKRLLFFIVFIVIFKYLFVCALAKRKKQNFEKIINTNRTYSSWYSDAINGVKVIKLWNLYSKKEMEYEQLIDKKVVLSKKNSLIEIFESFTDSFFESFIEFSIYLIGIIFMINKQLTLGGLFSFLIYSSLVIQPIFLVMSLKYRFAEMIPSLKDFEKFLDIDEDLSENIRNLTRAENCQDQTNETIKFQNVTYEIAGRKIINNICVSFFENEKIGIIGLNGSGKSTFLDLILGLKTPSDGEIYIGGKKINELDLYKYREQFSVVSQDGFLFNTTILENLLIENKDIDIVELANKKKCNIILQSLLILSEGLKTTTGSHGSKLSGGEKQKVELVRGLFKKSDFLVLDEATSNYDLESEKEFNNIIENSNGYKNIFIVTHRPEILKSVDRVMVVSEGKIVAIDKYENLLNSISDFKKFLYLKEEDNEFSI